MGLIGAVWRRLVSSLNPKRCDNANMLKNYPSPGKLAGVSRPPLQRSVGGVSDSSRALCVMSEKFPLKCCIRTTDIQTKNTYSLNTCHFRSLWKWIFIFSFIKVFLFLVTASDGEMNAFKPDFLSDLSWSVGKPFSRVYLQTPVTHLLLCGSGPATSCITVFCKIN